MPPIPTISGLVATMIGSHSYQTAIDLFARIRPMSTDIGAMFHQFGFPAAPRTAAALLAARGSVDSLSNIDWTESR